MPVPNCARRILAAVAAAGALLLASGCSTQKVAPGPTIAETTVVQARGTEPSRTVFEQSVATFGQALAASAAAPADTTLGGTAFTTGRAMLDLQCDRYLDAVGNSNQAAGNDRKQVSLVGGLASALMGLSGSSAREIAAVATSFSFAGSSMDAYTTSYLFSDASKSVTKIVRDAQGAFLNAIEGQLPTLDYAGAVALLTGYEAVCRPAQIRALIDDAVARGRVVAERPGQVGGDAEVASVLTLLRTQFARAFSEEEAIVLYAWYRSGQTLRTAMEASFEPIRTLVAGMPAAQVEQRLAVAFLPMTLAGSSVPGRWQAAVDQIVKAATPPPPPGAPASMQPATGVPTPAPVRLLRMPVLTVR